MRKTAQKLVATEYRSLSDSVRQSMIVEPETVLRVNRGPTLEVAELPFEYTNQTLLPKLGVKSWRDSGRLRLVRPHMGAAPQVQALLSRLTRAQMIMLKAYSSIAAPLYLYLFPYIDFSDISEARYLCRAGSAKFVSVCLRGESQRLFQSNRDKLAAQAQAIAKGFGDLSVVIDMALCPDRSTYLVDVNPGLDQNDLRALGLT